MSDCIRSAAPVSIRLVDNMQFQFGQVSLKHLVFESLRKMECLSFHNTSFCITGVEAAAGRLHAHDGRQTQEMVCLCESVPHFPSFRRQFCDSVFIVSVGIPAGM